MSQFYLRLPCRYVYNQIVSVLTKTQLTRIYEQRRNYDLRRLLAGAERLLDSLLDLTEREPAFLLGAIRCLPLASTVRDQISNTISSTCSKIKVNLSKIKTSIKAAISFDLNFQNLVFAILLANNQLITLVRMKKYVIHPLDLHLIFNLVNSSESFKTAESWTPICLPKFDARLIMKPLNWTCYNDNAFSGYLHGHVSYLSDDCQACLLLLTVDRDAFFTLSEAKQKISEVKFYLGTLMSWLKNIYAANLHLVWWPYQQFEQTFSESISYFLISGFVNSNEQNVFHPKLIVLSAIHFETKKIN